jgi:hypothetical protein
VVDRYVLNVKGESAGAAIILFQSALGYPSEDSSNNPAIVIFIIDG